MSSSAWPERLHATRCIIIVNILVGLIENLLLAANLNTSPGFPSLHFVNCCNFLPVQSGLVIPGIIEATKKMSSAPCDTKSACETVMRYGQVWRVMCLDTAGNHSSLWPVQSDFFSPPAFLLPFLYICRSGIILPILEWLQQRRCYSQGAVSPRCNSIHTQLDWPVIYRKSSSFEELWLQHTHTHTHTHTGSQY